MRISLTCFCQLTFFVILLLSLCSECAILKSRAEESDLSASHAKSYAESLSQRWKSVSEAHDQLTARFASLEAQHQAALEDHQQELKRAEERANKERGELQSEIVDAEYKLHKERESAHKLRDEQLESHAAEIRRLHESHSTAIDELNNKLSASLAEVEQQHESRLAAMRSSHSSELVDQRKTLEATHSAQLKATCERYEQLLRLSDASLKQQQAAIKRLEDSERQLHSIIDSHDEKLASLHAAHMSDLQQRMDKWRENRRADREEEERYLTMKMDAIKQTWAKREGQHARQTQSASAAMSTCFSLLTPFFLHAVIFFSPQIHFARLAV